MGPLWSKLRNNDNLAKKDRELAKLIAENKELRDQNTELRSNRVPLDVPWRTFGYTVFTNETKCQLYEEVERLELPDHCESINIIVIGDAGSGKSSFVNTLKTVLRNNDQISNVALSYGTTFPSTTNMLHTIILTTFGSGQKLFINDCRGIPKKDTEMATYERDLKQIINGHIRKNYRFNTDNEIQDDDVFYRRNPTVSEKMHCVLFAVNADKLHKESEYPTLKNIQRYLAGRNIPLRLILTKMDMLDLFGPNDCSGLFQSRHASQKVQLAKSIFGVHDSQILPIANYVDETTRNIIKDILALQAILNILQEAFTYIENL